MATKEIRVGILGAGGIAALSHLPEIADVDGLRVVHLAGRKRQRLEHLAQQFGIPRVSTDWEGLLNDSEVDAVIIGLPHPLHARAGLAVLDAGKHLFMQKPLCADMEEADTLVARADAHPELSVFCRPSYGAVVREIRRRVLAGDLGRISGAASRHSHGGPEVYYAEVADAFGEPHRSDDLWFFDPAQASVGALFDMGVYSVSNLVAVLGRAVAVTARMTTVAKPTTLEDTATVIIEFANGALGTAETGWCDPARTSFIRVHGTEAKLLSPGEEGSPLDRWQPTSAVRENAPQERSRPDLAKAPNQHAEWRDCIHGGTQPELSNIHVARHITEILLAALQSNTEGRTIALKTDPGIQSAP